MWEQESLGCRKLGGLFGVALACLRQQQLQRRSLCHCTSKAGGSCRREENRPTARVLGWLPRNQLWQVNLIPEGDF